MPEFTLAAMPTYTGTTVFPIAEDELRTFNPCGIANVDPAQAVGSDSVERYQVLPQEAGLLQLLRDGSLEMQSDKFVVMKPFARFPAELAEEHSVAFAFPPGMKLPEGNKGHSSVTTMP